MAKNNLNLVVLSGNLTTDPELRRTQNGTAVTTVRLANNRSFGEKETTTYVDCTFWDKKAEIICQYFSKGKPIHIEGELVTESWDDKTTGEKRSKLSVKGREFYFADGPAPENTKSDPAPKKGGKKPKPPVEDEDDDAPF